MFHGTALCNIQIGHGNTLEEQISIDETHRKIGRQILQLEKKYELKSNQNESLS